MKSIKRWSQWQNNIDKNDLPTQHLFRLIGSHTENISRGFQEERNKQLKSKNQIENPVKQSKVRWTRANRYAVGQQTHSSISLFNFLIEFSCGWVDRYRISYQRRATRTYLSSYRFLSRKILWLCLENYTRENGKSERKSNLVFQWIDKRTLKEIESQLADARG